MALRDRLRTLTAPTHELHEAELRDRFPLPGTTPIGEIQPRRSVQIAGEIQTVQVVPRVGSPWLEVTLSDGTGTAVALFTGRRRLGGVSPGRALALEGLARRDGHRLVLMNPAYLLLP